jgi:hypothetical protein
MERAWHGCGNARDETYEEPVHEQLILRWVPPQSKTAQVEGSLRGRCDG